jgi:hypothetical protein
MGCQAQKLPCIPSVTQGLSNFFHRQSHPGDEAPESCFGQNRHVNITKQAKKALVPSKRRGRRRNISTSHVRQLRLISSPCLLPPLSFGEALPDADELFSRVSGSDSLTSLPSDQIDRCADTHGQRFEADEYREECVPQYPAEHASMDARPPSPLAQPPPHQTQDTALLETFIREMMAEPERRSGRGRCRRGFNDGRTRPIPLLAEGSHGGYSLFPSPRQRTGTAAIPAVLHSDPEPEQPEARARLDSADLPVPASENHRVTTLDPLEEEICRNSGAYIPGKPAPVADSSDQSKARAAPEDHLPTSNDTSAIKDDESPVLDQPAILSPLPSRIRSQHPASHTPRPASFPSSPSLRTSKISRCRPKPVNRPQESQTSGIVAAANHSVMDTAAHREP